MSLSRIVRLAIVIVPPTVVANSTVSIVKPLVLDEVMELRRQHYY
jgi:hypothetical protein